MDISLFNDRNRSKNGQEKWEVNLTDLKKETPPQKEDVNVY